MSYRDLEEIMVAERGVAAFRDSEGKIVIAQMLNLPLLVGLRATLLQPILPSGNLQTEFDLVGFGALFTWAWQELFDGVNYFRRALGLMVLGGTIDRAQTAYRLTLNPPLYRLKKRAAIRQNTNFKVLSGRSLRFASARQKPS